MKTSWLTTLLIPAVSCLTLSCGSSGSIGRHLQSISIAQTVSGDQVQFVATGTYSAPPTTVTPLAVSWGFGPFAPPPGNLQYSLTTQPFSYTCTGSGPGVPVSVFAPANPNAPMTGSLPFGDVVTALAAVQCP